jgi:hypothetical protein
MVRYCAMCGYGQQAAVQVYFLHPRTKVEIAVCFRGCTGADGQPIKVLTPAEMGVLPTGKPGQSKVR